MVICSHKQNTPRLIIGAGFMVCKSRIKSFNQYIYEVMQAVNTSIIYKYNITA